MPWNTRRIQPECPDKPMLLCGPCLECFRAKPPQYCPVCFKFYPLEESTLGTATNPHQITPSSNISDDPNISFSTGTDRVASEAAGGTVNGPSSDVSLPLLESAAMEVQEAAVSSLSVIGSDTTCQFVSEAVGLGEVEHGKRDCAEAGNQLSSSAAHDISAGLSINTDSKRVNADASSDPFVDPGTTGSDGVNHSALNAHISQSNGTAEDQGNKGKRWKGKGKGKGNGRWSAKAPKNDTTKSPVQSAADDFGKSTVGVSPLDKHVVKTEDAVLVPKTFSAGQSSEAGLENASTSSAATTTLGVEQEASRNPVVQSDSSMPAPEAASLSPQDALNSEDDYMVSTPD